MVLGELSSNKSLLSGENKAIPRVPGSVAPVGTYRHEKKNRITEKNSLREMLEALNRENKILSNAKLIKSLPDRGEKIKCRISSLEKLIESKKTYEEDEATRLLSQLSISKVDVDALEWNSRSTCDLNSEEDPLKILAEKEVPQVRASSSFNPHVEQLSSRVDDLKPSARFIPHSSLKNEEVAKAFSSLRRTNDPSKILKPFELMPLPPDIKHPGVKPISLNESLRIQVKKDKELKELQIKRAAEKLLELRSEVDVVSGGGNEIKDHMNYRTTKVEEDSDDDSDNSAEFATPDGPSDDES